jgi:hypothetical protein
MQIVSLIHSIALSLPPSPPSQSVFSSAPLHVPGREGAHTNPYPSLLPFIVLLLVRPLLQLQGKHGRKAVIRGTGTLGINIFSPFSPNTQS